MWAIRRSEPAAKAVGVAMRQSRPHLRLFLRAALCIVFLILVSELVLRVSSQTHTAVTGATAWELLAMYGMWTLIDRVGGEAKTSAVLTGVFLCMTAYAFVLALLPWELRILRQEPYLGVGESSTSYGEDRNGNESSVTTYYPDTLHAAGCKDVKRAQVKGNSLDDYEHSYWTWQAGYVAGFDPHHHCVPEGYWVTEDADLDWARLQGRFLLGLNLGAGLVIEALCTSANIYLLPMILGFAAVGLRRRWKARRVRLPPAEELQLDAREREAPRQEREWTPKDGAS